MSSAEPEKQPSTAVPPIALNTAAAAAPAAAEHQPEAQGPARCLVYCRMRPTKAKELSDGAEMLVHMHKGIVSIRDDSNYDFDGSFGQDSHQSEIFETLAKPSLDSGIVGFKSAILSYGQTGSGKTFTMIGKTGDPNLAGIIPRSAEYIFSEIDRLKDQLEFTVEVQFVQIYRDHLGDLMSESGNQRVDIHWDAPGGVTLPGCSTHTIENKEDFMTLFDAGFKNRITVATAMNPESSRGHAALVVWLSSKSKVAGNIEQKRGKVTFIDLAGYERFSKTGISGNDPVRKDEAKTINASLLSLGHVVTSLSNAEKHIPWRNSKLTRLLQDSIGGRSRTVIVLTIGPSSDHLYETTNTLQFGQRAMAVKVQAKMKVIVDWEKHAKKLELILKEKNERIDELSIQLAGCVAAESELILRQQRDIDALKEKHAEELADLEENGADDVRLQTLRQQQNVEVEILYTQQAEERSYEEDKLDQQDEDKQQGVENAAEENNNNNNNQTPADGMSVSPAKDINDQTLGNTFYSPRTALANNDTETDDASGKAKDDIINELKRQVRLYRMKLLVPEKYRATSEEIEQEVMTSRRHKSETNLSENNNNNNNVNLENYVTKEEHEALRRTLENEIDHRDGLLANQLDLGAFSEMVPQEIKDKAAELALVSNNKKSTTSSSSSSDQNKNLQNSEAGIYIASLQRRITELTERLHQNNNNQTDKSSSNASAEPTATTATSSSSTSGISTEDATKAIQNAQQLLLNNFQEILLASKKSFGESSLEYSAALLAEHNDLSNKFSDHTQFLQTEIDTAKMEMEMALEGQNESLMEAIENSRHEAEAKFKIEKLSWEEDTEERVQKEIADAVKREKESGEDNILMLQAENTRLRNENSQKDQELLDLREQKSELESQNQNLLDESVTLRNNQNNKTNTTEIQQDSKQQQGNSNNTAKTLSPSSKSPSSQQIVSPASQNLNTATATVNPSTARRNEILDEIDSILMPVLKNKNQLLDDITEVLASATESAFADDDGGDFDHVPEIPLVSARVGTTNTNFTSLLNTNNNTALDPHASLSNFVNMVQNSKQNLSRQQSNNTIHQQQDNLNDSFGNGNLQDLNATATLDQQRAKQPTGIPSLNLGGLKSSNNNANNNMISPPMMSPGPSISVRAAQQNNNINTSRRQQQQQGATLPPNLPKVMMRIIKRLRDSSSESETKWLKCVVALSKISKSVTSLMSSSNNTIPTSSSGKNQTNTNTNNSNNNTNNSTGAQIAKSVADIMNVISAALYNTEEKSTGESNKTSRSSARTGGGMSEAEQARRSILKHSANANTLQSVIAGETHIAEQQALQSVILAQKEELARTDEEVISLAVEVARSKLQLRFEKQLLMALGEDDEDSVRENVAELDDIAAEQREQAQKEIGSNNNSNNKENKNELSFYRLKSVMLEQELRHKLSELAKTNQGGGNSNSSGASSTTFSSTNFGTQSKLTKQVELEQIQKEIHQASASIVTDMDLITSCREAELRVLSARLEACERELSSLKKDDAMFNNNKKNSNNTANNNSSNNTGSSSSGKSSGLTSSAETVFYHILRNLRKENSILHSVIRERGLQLRKYALTLMRHQLLPPSTDVSKLAGDVHSELRLAFAERDEEIYLKEQALNMRSTQVIVLEESLSALIDQLNKADITPCRANSRFAAELERTKDEIAGKLKTKSNSREELKTKIERVKTELEKIDQRMASHRQETGAETSRTAANGPVVGSAHAAQQSANDQLLLLRLQRDHLSHTMNISEVQLGALESEMSILKQSLLSASSTQAIESAIENRDAAENASVMSRLFRKMGGK